MAMMARMRSLAPAFIISVGALFVLFMVISDSNVLEALGGGRSNLIGSVNGEDITYQEYSKAVDIQRENQKKQTGKDVEDEELDQLNEQVWDALVTQRLLSQQIEKFNITVSDQEIKDVILSDNPPEFLKQNFVDSLGNFNRQLYEEAIFNPQNKEPLLQAEEYVRQNRLNEKLQSMLLASMNVSESEIIRKFADQNIRMNVQYALADLSQFPDSTIKLTDDDLKAYYNKNLDKYKNPAQRKLKYVLFSNSASKDDSINVFSNLENVAGIIKRDTASFKEIVDIYSTIPYKKDTLALTGFPQTVTDKISQSVANSLIGPIATPEGITLYNVVEIIPTNETLVKASHILINQFGSDEKNYDEAMKLYNELISDADFEKLAKEKSADPGSAQRGGDLGWFGKGAMVPEFEKAAMEGKVGIIQKPIKSNYGYHIIKVTGKSSNKYVVEKIVNPIKASASTKDVQFNSAQDFAYLAEKNGFEKEAELMNYKVLETAPFVKDAFSIPGIGTNKRLIDFSFDNGLNTVSEVHKIQAGYVVAKISEVINEGVKSFEEEKNIIKPTAIREKKYEKAKDLITKVKSKINGDLNKANSVNQRIIVSTTGNFTGGVSIPAIGRDFAFIDNALKLQLNKVSEPVKGQRGYFLLKVIERTPFDSSAYQIQRNTLRDNIMQEKKNYFFSQWLNKLKNDADIVDNRYQFLGR